MKAMRWSWREFCETPDYVKRFCRDILIRENAARAKATPSGGDDVQMAGHRRIRTRRR